MGSLFVSFFAFGLSGGRAGGHDRAVWHRRAGELECETLRVCAVELEAGERVVKTYLGDGERWKVDVQLSQEGGVKPLVVLKPTECAIETNLIVSTDRRIYDVLVKSRSCANPGEGLKLGPRRLRFEYGGFSQAWNDKGQPPGTAKAQPVYVPTVTKEKAPIASRA